MNRWGNRYQEDQQGINFLQILKANPSAYQLLQVPNLVDQVKSKNQKITQLLLEQENRHILQGLIRIAINPQSHLELTQQVLDKKMTHAAVEVITNLSEEFIEAIFEENSTQDDQVIQVEKEYPILNFILKVVTEPRAEETGLAYFSKLVTPFIYQHPEEMLKVFTYQAISTVVEFFWSPSMAELVSKLLEAESQKDFFQKQKLTFFRTLCQEIASIDSEEKIEKIIQNFSELLESLVQKHEDKYQKAKYANMIKNIMKEIKSLEFLITHLEKYHINTVIKTQILHCLEAILRIHEPHKPGSKVHDEENSIELIELNQEFKEKVKTYFTKHGPKEFISDSSIELLNYFKAIKKVLTLAPEYSSDILTKKVLSDTLAIMKDQPNNNILHNYQKDVLLLGIKDSNEVCSVLQNEMNLAESLRSNISEGNSKVSYEHQLFLIGEAVKAKSQQSNSLVSNWSDLDQPLKNKRAFYSVLIGGNPRGNNEKWGSFQDDFILKPLEQKNDPGTLGDCEEKHKERNTAYQIVTRLDELEGTEVLSEEEDFPIEKVATDNPDNPHYFDDLGMPELPLDSDRSEDENRNASNSLEDLPMDLKENSNKDISQECLDSIEESIKKSGQYLQNGSPLIQRVDSIIAIDLEEPSPILINISGNSFEKELPKASLFVKNQSKQELSLIDREVIQLTESVNIDDQDLVEETNQKHTLREEGKISSFFEEGQREVEEQIHVPCQEEVSSLLLNKYDLSLKEKFPCLDEMAHLLMTRYGLPLHSIQ